MATSPIYGWEEPDDTDLVKDGAAAIRTLGNAIDTTMGTMTPKSIVDAKGDLIAATAADTPARLAVGANDLFLTAASGEATGLKYTGDYISWTPTWTGLTLGNGTQRAVYQQVGKTVRFTLQINFGTTTAITGVYPSFTLPKTLLWATSAMSATYFDSGVTNHYATYYINNATLGYLISNYVSGTSIIEAAVSPTAPFTWGNNDQILLTGSYEVA